MPFVPRIYPAEAVRIVTDTLLPHFECVPINKREYCEALALVQSGGWAGAEIYDALLLGCAVKCGADRIYTFNLADFQLLAPAGLRGRISAP